MKVGIWITANRLGANYVVGSALQSSNRVSGHVRLKDASVNKTALLALRDALGRFHAPAEIELYTDNRFLRDNFHNIPKWQHHGWKRSNGYQVKFSDLWQQVDTLSNIHQMTVFDINKPKEEKEVETGTI